MASPDVTVSCAAGPGTFAFGVHDSHPYRPAPTAPEPGTGLAAVAELTHGPGGTAVVRGDADGPGKSIWTTVPPRSA
ncbi:hypothetical protein ACFU6R_30815 [Streptomyces sp. NPDC057499]|uniref:hypothetical protein n=1 Tax=Streptomyces sp. NPDC057499 TaxID=3346150 RepID=UPI0036B186CD